MESIELIISPNSAIRGDESNGFVAIDRRQPKVEGRVLAWQTRHVAIKWESYHVPTHRGRAPEYVPSITNVYTISHSEQRGNDVWLVATPMIGWGNTRKPPLVHKPIHGIR